MSRHLYQVLLWLHPPAFRRQFAEEMLGILDEAVAVEGAAALLFDALLSLPRQWFLRSGLWKVAAAGFGAAMQLAPALGWGWHQSALLIPRGTAGEPIQMDAFVAIACCLIAFVVAMVVATVLWANRLARPRPAHLRRKVG
jgi:hypothetical protein